MLLLLLAGSLSVSAQSDAQTDDPAQKWSKRQMSHMLADRPIMKNYQIGKQIFWVSQQDSIWQWVAEGYAGKTTNFWTAWHEAPPVETFEAMHCRGPDNAYLYIKDITPAISDGHNETFEKLWRCAVFELLNLENACEFSEIELAAYDGKCTRDEFVKKKAMLEHRALGKLQRFCMSVWTPWCKTNGFVSNSAVWRHGYHPNFETWLSSYPPDSRYPWQYYGESYEHLRQAGEKKRLEANPSVK